MSYLKQGNTVRSNNCKFSVTYIVFCCFYFLPELNERKPKKMIQHGVAEHSNTGGLDTFDHFFSSIASVVIFFQSPSF